VFEIVLRGRVTINKKGGNLCRICMQRTVDRGQYIVLQGLTGPVHMESRLCGVVSNRMCYPDILIECVVSSPFSARGYGAKYSTSVYTVQYAHDEPASWLCRTCQPRYTPRVLSFTVVPVLRY
jgi:hypothetical protein